MNEEILVDGRSISVVRHLPSHLTLVYVRGRRYDSRDEDAAQALADIIDDLTADGYKVRIPGDDG